MPDACPDLVLLQAFTTCARPQCRAILPERRLTTTAGNHRLVQVLSNHGSLSAWLVAHTCSTCRSKTFPYFYTHPQTLNFRLSASGWWYRDDVPPPQALLVTDNVSVAWSFLEDIDARMVRNPFSWVSLAKELADRHGQKTFGLECASLAHYLLTAWQLYVILEWRRRCLARGLDLPSPINVRPACSPGRHRHVRTLIDEHLPLFRKYFTQVFVQGHADVCPKRHCRDPACPPAQCATIIVLDGNNKVYRSICPVVTDACVDSQVLQKSKNLPCGHRPRKGHRTCMLHASVDVAPPKTRRLRKPKTVRQCQAKGAAAAVDCNTRKDSCGPSWHKTSGPLSALHPCGIVADLREMYVHESLLQVCAVIEYLFQETKGTVVNIAYDDGCHLWESINKAATEGSDSAKTLLELCDVCIDPWHLRGHKRAMCHEKFNPKTRDWASKANLEAAEGGWKYFNKHRHTLRYQHGPGFNLHLAWVALRRNELISDQKW